jgi:hypothetical protein
MRAQKIGRALGTGLRVAGRIAEQRMAGQQKSPESRSWGTGSGATAATAARSAGRVAARASGGAARGIGDFFKLFTRLGGILFLEVTGAFFLLLGIAFVPFLWKGWHAGLHGADRWHFGVEALVAAMFLYLGLSSFWRARRR